MLIIDGSLPAKRFKSNMSMNCATSGSELTLHISEQIVGFKVRDNSKVDNLFHGFTCQRNRWSFHKVNLATIDLSYLRLMLRLPTLIFTNVPRSNFKTLVNPADIEHIFLT